MSTLPIRASYVPQVWPFPDFTRFQVYRDGHHLRLHDAHDVFTEAQQKASGVHKRYPFAE